MLKQPFNSFLRPHECGFHVLFSYTSDEAHSMSRNVYFLCISGDPIAAFCTLTRLMTLNRDEISTSALFSVFAVFKCSLLRLISSRKKSKCTGKIATRSRQSLQRKYMHVRKPTEHALSESSS